MDSIKIILEKSETDLFMKSKWWGNPDMPVNIDVPDDLTFVCQIRCEDLADLDTKGILPHKGMLYFFAAIDYYFGNFDSYSPVDFYWNNDDVKVFYVEDIEKQEFEQVVFVDDDDNPIAMKELKIVFSKGEPSCEGNKLLGEPYNREWEDWGGDYADWCELIQIDSDDYDECTLNFMDWGMLHVIISPEDLKNKEFGRVSAVICST